MEPQELAGDFVERLHGEDCRAVPEGDDVKRLVEFFGSYAVSGGIAFGGTMKVYPMAEGDRTHSLGRWNEEATWKSGYGESHGIGLCFAADILGYQYFMTDGGVVEFDPEDGSFLQVADSLMSWWEEFREGDYRKLLQGVLEEHSAKNGRPGSDEFLFLMMPLVIGGEVKASNVVVVPELDLMRMRASLARQVKDLPPDTWVELDYGTGGEGTRLTWWKRAWRRTLGAWKSGRSSEKQG